MATSYAEYIETRAAGRAALEAADAVDREKVDAIIGYAARHYNEGGWDLVVECWEPYEVYAYLKAAHGDVDGALAAIGDVVGVVDAYRAEIIDA